MRPPKAFSPNIQDPLESAGPLLQACQKTCSELFKSVRRRSHDCGSNSPRIPISMAGPSSTPPTSCRPASAVLAAACSLPEERTGSMIENNGERAAISSIRERIPGLTERRCLCRGPIPRSMENSEARFSCFWEVRPMGGSSTMFSRSTEPAWRAINLESRLPGPRSYPAIGSRRTGGSIYSVAGLPAT